jgi:hypothetical protein
MDIKGDWKKRAVSGLMVLAMALSLLPTSILAADTRSVTDNAIKNGSFEEPAFHDKNSPQWPAKEVPDWDTTASDRKIEFGSTRKNGTVPHIVGEPNLQDSGCQFAELNADEESTLYQYAETVGGNVYEWGLSHRGRDGVDQMALIIGPKQDVDPAKPSADGKDQFMRMTDWVKSHAEKLGVKIPVTGCTQKITVYSKKFTADGGFQNDIEDAFSALPSNVYTEKWNVWIIGTNNNNNQNSSFWMANGRYMRLKNLEIGYTLPKHISQKMAMQNMRVYLSGVNLFTFSPFKLWDPDLQTGATNYPNNRIINIGLTIGF